MATAAPIFYGYVVVSIMIAFVFLSLGVQAVALIHCLTQRGPAFQALGTLPKGAWAGILAVCLLLTGALWDVLLMGMIGIGVGLVYMLDVRPGLKDISDGKGFW
ncbi:DUF2516 family protein [Actinoplanes xinjiangensis]|jgi:hypothetical protein|uniref:Uncharacterized protein DUF2516 n=1 Tax=Actinoplanes xinjiangensis TaxID=512350 RepID=A0A316FG53_9ACTN|nr:DUF2516 family protein [Actinoplanes xinjiangensis]PWK46760.1 uncharacterized protein DUF2516 [Actinoplanes xinjiangensis]GIF40418.1 hypothetical protein Axi01nite_47290 [Actinoplanes xinjiangensis]